MLLLSLMALVVFLSSIALSMTVSAGGVVVSAGSELDGITTLVWGTSGALRDPLPAGGYAGEGYYIVESIDASEKAEQLYGENGTGIECWRMTLKHGKRWNVTVTDDTTMTPPTVNNTVTVVDMIGNRTQMYVAKIINNDFRGARKSPGQRILQVESLTLVDAAPVAA